MNLASAFIWLLLLGSAVPTLKAQSPGAASEDYLNWTAAQSKTVGEQWRKKGRVGSSFDFRVIHTERAINYKLRATLMTPEAIRAAARLEQMRNRLTDDQTRELVKEAESSGDLVVMIEIDPREGSGIVPLSWRVFLQPPGLRPDSPGAITGVKLPKLRNLKAFSGVFRRDYDYDVFMVAFPLVDENKKPLISPDLGQIELLVGIYSSEGRVRWNFPDSVRKKIESLSK